MGDFRPCISTPFHTLSGIFLIEKISRAVPIRGRLDSGAATLPAGPRVLAVIIAWRARHLAHALLGQVSTAVDLYILACSKQFSAILGSFLIIFESFRSKMFTEWSQTASKAPKYIGLQQYLRAQLHLCGKCSAPVGERMSSVRVFEEGISTGDKILVRSYSFVFFTFFTFLWMLVSRPDSIRFL